MNVSRQNQPRRPSQARRHPFPEPAARPHPRIHRIPVFHRSTFEALLRDALRGVACLRHGGAYWEPLHRGRGFSLYRRAPDLLACLHRRLRHYEFCFYRALLDGCCGPDGMVRTRTRLWRRPDGVYSRSFHTPGDDGL